MAGQHSSERDFYSVLGVEPTATAEEIHKAYRARVRVTHPDRFDKDTHPQEWASANEMLRDLNAAYSILKDASSRAEYDRWRAQGTVSEGPNSEPDEESSAHMSKEGRSLRFDDLPVELRLRMTQRQNGSKKNQFQIATDSLLRKCTLIAIFACWFVFLFFTADSAKWKATTNLWQGAVTLGIGWLISRQILSAIKWCQSTLKSFFYITPLYFVKTEYDLITFWPLFALQDIGITHNYRSGSYQNSEVMLQLGENHLSLTLPSIEQVELFDKRLRFYDMKIREALASDNNNYFVTHDDFAGTSGIQTASANNKGGELAWVLHTAGAVICSLTYLLFMARNEKLAASRWVEHPTPALAQPIAAPVRPVTIPEYRFKPAGPTTTPQLPKRVSKPPIPEQPLPLNGEVKVFAAAERIAPFQIETSGGQHYLVKLALAQLKRK